MHMAKTTPSFCITSIVSSSNKLQKNGRNHLLSCSIRLQLLRPLPPHTSLQFLSPHSDSLRNNSMTNRLFFFCVDFFLYVYTEVKCILLYTVHMADSFTRVIHFNCNLLLSYLPFLLRH